MGVDEGSDAKPALPPSNNIDREVQTKAMLRSKLGTLLVVSAALSCAAGFALDAQGSIANLELWIALAVLLLLSGAVLIVLGQND
ncbi:hypothetical protein LZ683_22950 [Comamonas testosteroni]|nr:hypothetical protein [Comamonas testosteroni]WEE76969.1 hypothetical protein LZ683_22950 [Comamonas testosteroni]